MTDDSNDADVPPDGAPGSSERIPEASAVSSGASARAGRSTSRKLLFAAGTVVLAIGFAEIALRASHLISTGTWDFLPAVRMASELYAPHPYLCYVMRPGVRFTGYDGQVRINRWGFRGRDVERIKPQGVVRIACLGGSTTFSLNASDNDHTWPAQLERMLNERHAPTRFEVLNFGTPGYCAVESLLIFTLRGLDFAPDIVLVHDALNDVPAVFRSDAASDYTHFRAPYTRLGGRWLGRSAIGRLIMLAALEPHRPPAGGLAGLSAEGVKLFQRHVESTILLARSRGIQPVIVTMPDRLPRDDEECRRRCPEIALTRVLVRALRHLSSQREVSLIDLSATFPKDPRYFTDDAHKTDAGLELAARMIADGLEQSGTLARTPESHSSEASE